MTYGEKFQLARNHNTSEDILRKLAKDKDFVIRCMVASNRNASSTLLIMIFEYERSLKEPDLDVMYNLHNNKKLPTFAKRVIETLYGNEDML